MNQATVIPNVVESHQQPTTAIVEETITKHRRGRVKFLATYWFARFHDPNHLEEVCRGTTVNIIGREGLTLLISPIEN